VETYKADFLHIELFRPFILRMAEVLIASTATDEAGERVADERAGGNS
jgi:hypothetical protein